MKRKKLLAHCLAMGVIIGAWLACVLLFATLMGCKPQERVVYQTRTDSVYIARTDTFTRVVEVVRRDTIESRDSVILREYITVKVNEGGDTVWRDRVIYRDRWHDGKQSATVLTDSKTDSKSDNVSAQVKTNTVYVKETNSGNSGKITLWQRIKDCMFAVGLLALIAFVYWIWKKK